MPKFILALFLVLPMTAFAQVNEIAVDPFELLSQWNARLNFALTTHLQLGPTFFYADRLEYSVQLHEFAPGLAFTRP